MTLPIYFTLYVCSLVIAVILNTNVREIHLQFLELSVFNLNKIYLATITINGQPLNYLP